ncbi:MAG: class I SAM-dependent methyltransferase [Bacteroidales bacterium]
MQYDPIKKTLGRFFSEPVFMRKVFYSLLDLLLLRTWHVKRALRKFSQLHPGEVAVLDAGAGFGQYTWRMSRMNKLWKIKAIDIDSEHINDCGKFFASAGLSDRVSCETCDLASFDEKAAYDMILCVDVMEHIREDERVLRNFNRALKPDGMLLISTPSDKGGSDVHSEKEHSFIDEHVRNGYGTGEISRKLTEAGFKDVGVSYTYGRPGNISWRLSMKYPVKMLNASGIFYVILPFYFMLVIPVSLILNCLDLNFKHKSGTGLLVTASR